MFSKPVPESSHDVSSGSFTPASSLRCDGFYKAWLQVIQGLSKGRFCTHIPPDPTTWCSRLHLSPPWGSPWFRRAEKTDTRTWTEMRPMSFRWTPGTNTGGNRAHLKALSSLLTQLLLPGPFRLTLHSHSTWTMHVLCSFC